MLTLLEELGCDYDPHVLNLKNGEQRKPEYLAINPMGKVPAIRHGDAVVTEQPAVYLYLADLFPRPDWPGDGRSAAGPYLRWLVFYGSSFEPAVIDRLQQRAPAPMATSPYGDYDTMLGALTGQLARGPYLFGDRFTAADVLWGVAPAWTTAFKWCPRSRRFSHTSSASTGGRRGSRCARRTPGWRRRRPERRQPCAISHPTSCVSGSSSRAISRRTSTATPWRAT